MISIEATAWMCIRPKYGITDEELAKGRREDDIIWQRESKWAARKAAVRGLAT